MTKIVFCCFTYRCLANYSPLLKMMADNGDDISLIIFPRLCDPDHQGLFTTSFYVRSSYPIDRNGALLNGSLEQIVSDIGSPDLLFLGTCNLGPERVLGSICPAKKVIGLQHGFYQDWDDYNHNSSIPMLGVFGRRFADRLVKPSVVLGLPKLDLISPLPANPDGDIIYAAQYSNDPQQLMAALDDLQRLSGKKIFVRPHPEGREHLQVLRNNFDFLDPEQPLTDCLERAALVVTTGSTIVLESLAANVPVVVIPDCHGLEYSPAGLVTPNISGAAIIDTWRSSPERTALTKRFLFDYTGSDTNNRTLRAHASLTRLINEA